MAKITYVEKLKDPRWQKKRLEILSRDNFTCTNGGCFDKTSTLHVHHLDYISGNDPWDYPNEYFMTVCESCHDEINKERPVYEKEIIKQLRLKLKDTFIQSCAVQLFTSLTEEELHDLIYMLWEIKDFKKEIYNAVLNAYHEVTERPIEPVKKALKKKEVISGKD
ncbi:MAG TPA: hypothetical protein PLX17_00505 [Chitinophagaceae bacterium]|nr:hypothetical protein [Chitinophagaceae bacterium]